MANPFKKRGPFLLLMGASAYIGAALLVGVLTADVDALVKWVLGIPAVGFIVLGLVGVGLEGRWARQDARR